MNLIRFAFLKLLFAVLENDLWIEQKKSRKICYKAIAFGVNPHDSSGTGEKQRNWGVIHICRLDRMTSKATKKTNQRWILHFCLGNRVDGMPFSKMGNPGRGTGSRMELKEDTSIWLCWGTEAIY